MIQEATVEGGPGAAEVQAAIRSARLLVREIEPRTDHAREDPGETAAIALARELSCAVLLDDRSARAHASRLGATLTGTLGVLIGLSRSARIDRLEPLLDELAAIGFRMTPELRKEALRAAGEG